MRWKDDNEPLNNGVGGYGSGHFEGVLAFFLRY
jgi:hypothetical protein